MAAAYKVEGTELFDMVADLTRGLVNGLQLGTVGDEGLQKVTTSSEEAFQLYVRGKALLEDLAYTDAAEQFRRALDVDAGFGVARLRLAMALILSGDKTSAKRSLREAAAKSDQMPEDSSLLTLSFFNYYAASDFEAGNHQMTALFARYPGEKEAYLMWARALSDLKGDHLQASQKLRRAMELDPNFLPAVAALADQLADRGAKAGAVEMLKQAISRYPSAKISLDPLITEYDG